MTPMCCLCSSALYTAKQVVINLSSTCGPAISIVLFLCLGNSWEVSSVRVQAGFGKTSCFHCSDVAVSKPGQPHAAAYCSVKLTYKFFVASFELQETCSTELGICGATL
jgi:hypothetical protein